MTAHTTARWRAPGPAQFADSTLGLWHVAAAIASGALLAVSHGLHPLWPLAWIASVPVLVAVVRLRWPVAAGLGALAGAIASVSLFGYMLSFSAPLGVVMLSLIRAAQWAIYALVGRIALRRLPGPAGILVLPALMAGFEVCQARISPHGSGGSLAYSQMDLLPLIQVAALGGTAAIVLVLGLFANLLTYAIVLRGAGWRALVVPLVVIILGLGYGAARLAAPPAGPPGPRVAVIATDRYEDIPRDWRRVWEAYAPEVAAAADDQGADIVVLPEKIARVEPAETQALLAAVGELTTAHGVAIVLGVDERVRKPGGKEVARNRAYLLTADGRVISYDKQHLIPGPESHFTPGSRTVVTPVAGVRAGVLICKDLDFPATVREYSAAEAALLLVPAWDFGADAWFHSRFAILRAVENGVTIARSPREGLLSVSDDRGRVLAEARTSDEFETVVADIPSTTPTPTVYAAIGDALGWVCLILATVALAFTARRRSDGGALSSPDIGRTGRR